MAPSLKRTALALPLLLLCLTAPARSAPSKFLWVSDVHLDPHYGTPNAYGSCTDAKSSPMYGKPGCDSPEVLVNLTFAAMNEALPQPDFVLLTGDSCRHDTFDLTQLEVRRGQRRE